MSDTSRSLHFMGSYPYMFGPDRQSRSASLNVSSQGRLSRDFSFEGNERRSLLISSLTGLGALRGSQCDFENLLNDDSYHDRTCLTRRIVPIFKLIIASALTSMCAEFLVGTIDEITRQGQLSESMIGLIIIPVVSNLAEHITAVTFAAREKMDLAITVSIGSAVQIALCVTPLTVLAGWLLDRRLALTFNFFEMSSLLGSVLLVNFMILNGRTTGLKGGLMLVCYVIIG